MCRHAAPQGLLAVCRPLDVAARRRAATRSPRLLVVLAHVRDPGNAGTVIRGADAAGADAVLVSDASVDVYNPKVVRATAGSLFHLPVVTGRAHRATLLGSRPRGRAAAAGRRRLRRRTCCTTSDLARAARAGSSATRRGASNRRCATPATRSSGCRSTAGPSR